jgi:DNA (cytosine-5)-methyltransferase 1
MGHDKSHANAGGQVAIMQRMQLRRLTPRECERLMGLPDDYTLVNYRGKPAKDGPRYKVIGNGIVVPELRWIGERIDRIDALMKAQSQAPEPS